MRSKQLADDPFTRIWSWAGQMELPHGGHLLSATVRPTCERVLTESPRHLQKQIDPESGIALIRF